MNTAVVGLDMEVDMERAGKEDTVAVEDKEEEMEIFMMVFGEKV